MKIGKHILSMLLAVLMWASTSFASAAENVPLQLMPDTRHASLSGHIALYVDTDPSGILGMCQREPQY